MLRAKLFITVASGHLIIFIALAIILKLPMVLTSVVIYILLIPVYLIFYVCTELVSPSKRILQIIASSNEANYTQVFKALEQENFIMLRLEELEQSGCLKRSDNRFELTASGRKIASILDVYQRLLGRDIGG